ncbi:hypothetical protein [Bradyrhizobium sp. USDA 4473]
MNDVVPDVVWQLVWHESSDALIFLLHRREGDLAMRDDIGPRPNQKYFGRVKPVELRIVPSKYLQLVKTENPVRRSLTNYLSTDASLPLLLAAFRPDGGKGKCCGGCYRRFLRFFLHSTWLKHSQSCARTTNAGR